jgi:hypothetical protein
MDESPRAALGTETEPVQDNDGRVKIGIAPKKVVTLMVERK